MVTTQVCLRRTMGRTGARWGAFVLAIILCAAMLGCGDVERPPTPRPPVANDLLATTPAEQIGIPYAPPPAPDGMDPVLRAYLSREEVLEAPSSRPPDEIELVTADIAPSLAGHGHITIVPRATTCGGRLRQLHFNPPAWASGRWGGIGGIQCPSLRTTLTGR
jgi:hypothetical protein